MVVMDVKKHVQNIIILIFVFHIVHLKHIKMDMLVLVVHLLVQFVLEVLSLNVLNVILVIIYMKQLVIKFVQMKILMQIFKIQNAYKHVQIFYIYLKCFVLILVLSFYIDMKLLIKNNVLIIVYQNHIY